MWSIVMEVSQTCWKYDASAYCLQSRRIYWVVLVHDRCKKQITFVQKYLWKCSILNFYPNFSNSSERVIYLFCLFYLFNFNCMSSFMSFLSQLLGTRIWKNCVRFLLGFKKCDLFTRYFRSFHITKQSKKKQVLCLLN